MVVRNLDLVEGVEELGRRDLGSGMLLKIGLDRRGTRSWKWRRRFGGGSMGNEQQNWDRWGTTVRLDCMDYVKISSMAMVGWA